MALVSYGASDDSDTSDTEDGRITTNSRANPSEKKAGHISDDDFDTVSSSSVTSTSVSAGRLADAPIKSWLGHFDGKNSDDSVNSTSISSLDDLPAPQPNSSSTTEEVEELELEDEVKPKPSEIAIAPKPPKKIKRPVKITIPSLDETTEKEEYVSVKKPAPSKVNSGLFSLLPAPVYSSKKELNRPLIPHTLTKKLAPAPVSNSDILKSKSMPGDSKSFSEVASTSSEMSTRMTPFNALTGYDSDSDDNADESKGSTSNFFSLSSSSEVKTVENSTTSERLQSEEVSSSEPSSNVLKKEASDNGEIDSVTVSSNKGSEEDVKDKEVDPGPELGAINDAPLDFRSMNRLSAWSASSYGFLAPVGPTGPIPSSKAHSSYQTEQSAPSNSMYNMANYEISDAPTDANSEAITDDDLKQFMSDKEFQKLQGKRKRGLEEVINIVDANVDDYVDPSEVSKHLTEETEYVSHKSKDNLPTAQQRRKKQITYLAYQAKERELELKNTWAQNRMTKKQTQSKYGF